MGLRSDIQEAVMLENIAIAAALLVALLLVIGTSVVP